MKHHRAASEREPQGREQPGHYAQLPLCEMTLSLREHLPGLLEPS
jgi:hypothetical protein